MTERRCPGCRTWYPKSYGDCPQCGHEGARYNATADRYIKNKALYDQVEKSNTGAQYMTLKSRYKDLMANG